MSWKKTGVPAHNNAEERSKEDEPDYEPNPHCDICGGSGTVVYDRPAYNHEGECVDVEFDIHPCDCVFSKWVSKPDTHCSQCKGTGAVQERLIVNGEVSIFFYDCVCLRYVKESVDYERKGNSH